jgi:hypothetical protein
VLVPICTAGTSLCGTACYTLSTNVNHCGACGTVCAPTNGTGSCTSGVCGVAACNSGYGNCNANPADGCETNTLTTLTDCGTCGNACPSYSNATSTCLVGSCGMGACNSGYANCNANPVDGCESNLTSDPTNCGTCGVVCAMGETCVNSACTGS